MILIKNVTITPNPVNIGQSLKIVVEMAEPTWGDIKSDNSTWQTVKNSYTSWDKVRTNNI